MQANIKDVARVMGVNVGTISRALNDKPGVSDALRRRIARKATAMGYRPNAHARGLVTRRTETVGLLSGVVSSDFLSNPFYTGVFAGVESETRRRNYALMFASVATEVGLTRGEMPKFVAENRVDGVLVVGAVDADILDHMKQSPYPFVLVDYHLPGHGIDTVVTDNRRGGREITEHLINLGHRNIAFVGGEPLDHGNFFERLEGYRAALKAHELPLREELVQGGEIVGGYRSILRILDRVPDVTAVVGCNDANALAAMKALRERGLRIPEDISVVGYDDISAAEESTPALTTMRVDKEAMGRKSAQRLIDKIEQDGDGSAHETIFPAEMIVRGSTGTC